MDALAAALMVKQQSTLALLQESLQSYADLSYCNVNYTKPLQMEIVTLVFSFLFGKSLTLFTTRLILTVKNCYTIYQRYCANVTGNVDVKLIVAFNGKSHSWESCLTSDWLSNGTLILSEILVQFNFWQLTFLTTFSYLASVTCQGDLFANEMTAVTVQTSHRQSTGYHYSHHQQAS